MLPSLVLRPFRATSFCLTAAIPAYRLLILLPSYMLKACFSSFIDFVLITNSSETISELDIYKNCLSNRVIHKNMPPLKVNKHKTLQRAHMCSMEVRKH